MEVALGRTTISRNVNLLVDAGSVDVKEAADKCERVRLLNEAGRKVVADATPHWAKAQDQVEQGTDKFLRAPSSGQLLQALEGLQEAAGEADAR